MVEEEEGNRKGGKKVRRKSMYVRKEREVKKKGKKGHKKKGKKGARSQGIKE